MKHPKVLHWDDERCYGHGFIVTTAYGWAFEPSANHNDACHVKGFDKASEARAELKWVKTCSCLRCTSHGKEDIAP